MKTIIKTTINSIVLSALLFLTPKTEAATYFSNINVNTTTGDVYLTIFSDTPWTLWYSNNLGRWYKGYSSQPFFGPGSVQVLLLMDRSWGFLLPNSFYYLEPRPWSGTPNISPQNYVPGLFEYLGELNGFIPQ